MERWLTLRRILLTATAMLVVFGIVAFHIATAVRAHAPVDQFPAQPLTTFPATVVVKQSANVRSGPGTDFSVISGARPGQRLTVYACNLDCSWYLLADDCWIAAFLVKPEHGTTNVPSAVESTPLPTVVMGGAPLPTVVVGIPITVTATIVQSTRCPQTAVAVNTFAGPGTFYAVVDTRPAGECIAVVGRNTAGDWLQLSHGMWISAAAILYADPIEMLPVVDQIFTATPVPPPTPLPTATPTPIPTALTFTPIATVGEWIAADEVQKLGTASLWTEQYIANGLVSGDAALLAPALVTCVDNALRNTADILGPSYPAQTVADGCILVLN